MKVKLKRPVNLREVVSLPKLYTNIFKRFKEPQASRGFKFVHDFAGHDHSKVTLA
jgi:hypothetical protein